jgi:dienelactone hydrolase
MILATGPIPHIRMRRLRWLGVLGSALIAATLATSSASATISERERSVRNAYEFDAWDCGYRMHVVGVETHLLKWRVSTKIDDFLYFTNNYAFQETWTADDGRFFTLSGNGIFKDVKATSLGGSLYQFTIHENGQPIVITNSEGVVVSRDRGNLTASFTIDFATGEENFLGLQLRGPHPLFGVDLCQAVAPLTAISDSAQYQTLRPIGTTDSPVGYTEYLPPTYTTSGAESPLLLFFHGYGETGDGTPEAVANLLFAGIPKYINVGGWPTDRPFVVLAPQHVEEPPGFDFSSCDGVPFGGSCNMQVQHDNDNASPAFCTTPDEVHDFIDYAVAHYNVDPTRVYVTGLSCGAYGIWEYLAKYQGAVQAAAAVPIAGDGRPAWSPDYCGLGETPLWAFHGAFDDTVDPAGSIEPLTALQACPGVPADEAKLTFYPDRDHNSWDPAYGGANGDDIYAWMLGFTNP